MATQPMGIGVRRDVFKKASDDTAKKTELLERQAAELADKFLEELQKSQTVSLLVEEMESTMLRVYLESPDGQAQWRLFEKLQTGIEPSAVIRNMIRKQMRAEIKNILETQATP